MAGMPEMILRLVNTLDHRAGSQGEHWGARHERLTPREIRLWFELAT